MNIQSKCVVAFSGGMDSTVLLYHALSLFEEVYAVSFVYGQRHSKELDHARRIIAKLKQTPLNPLNVLVHRIIDISFLKELCTGSSITNSNIDVAQARTAIGDPQTVNYVPFRNLTLLSLCSTLAETISAGTVFYGAAQADTLAGYWDGSHEFLRQVQGLAKLNRRHRISIEAPLLDLSKADIILNGLRSGVDFSDTWTCYEGKDEACGTCTACSLRLQGFISVGIRDPIKYSKPIYWDTLMLPRTPA